MTQPSANDLLNQGRGTGLKMGKSHAQMGQMLGGRIVADPSTYHVREYDKNNPGNGPLKYFPSGDPIYGLTVDVQTNERDASIEDDDGVRRMFIEKKRQLNAVRDAVRASGANGLAVGGTLYMAWIGEEDSTAASPAMLWAAQYTPPTVGIPGAPPQQPPAQTYQQSAPATAPYVPPAPVQAAPVQPAPVAQPPAVDQPAAAAVAALGNLDPAQIQQLLAMAAQNQG